MQTLITLSFIYFIISIEIIDAIKARNKSYYINEVYKSRRRL